MNRHPVRQETIGILIALIGFGAYTGWLGPMRVFDPLQLRAEDVLTRWRYQRSPLPPILKDFVLVAIDDESYRRLNRRWPWDRAFHSAVIERISSVSPRLLLVDVVFGGESNPESDARLEAAVKNAGNVILASYFGPNEEFVAPLPSLVQAAAGTGSIDRMRSSDSAMRRTRLVHWSTAMDASEYAIEVEATAFLLGARPQTEGTDLVFVRPDGKVVQRLQLAIDGSLPIRYQTMERNLTVVPVADLLNSDAALEKLRGKTVVYGATGYLFQDRHLTPLGMQPGSVILLNGVLTVVQGQTTREVPVWLQWVLILAGSLVLGVLAVRIPALIAALAAAGCVLLFGAASAALFLRGYLWDYTGFPVCVGAVTAVGLVRRGTLLAIEAAKLRVEATTDSLTGVANLQYFQVRLGHELERVERYGDPMGVVIFDMDGFKAINDTYGHGAGNDVLKELAERLKQRLRKSDLIARFGGDEFCLLLFHSDAEQSGKLAESIRGAVAELPFPTRAGSVRATLSLGVTGVTQKSRLKMEEVMEQADLALYESKRSGRNRVTVYTPELQNKPQASNEQRTRRWAKPADDHG